MAYLPEIVGQASAYTYNDHGTANRVMTMRAVVHGLLRTALSGEHLYCLIALQNATINSAPSGWTLVASGSIGALSTYALYHKVAGGSEPASYTWNISGPGHNWIAMQLISVETTVGNSTPGAVAVSTSSTSTAPAPATTDYGLGMSMFAGGYTPGGVDKWDLDPALTPFVEWSSTGDCGGSVGTETVDTTPSTRTAVASGGYDNAGVQILFEGIGDELPFQPLTARPVFRYDPPIEALRELF